MRGDRKYEQERTGAFLVSLQKGKHSGDLGEELSTVRGNAGQRRF